MTTRHASIAFPVSHNSNGNKVSLSTLLAANYYENVPRKNSASKMKPSPVSLRTRSTSLSSTSSSTSTLPLTVAPVSAAVTATTAAAAVAVTVTAAVTATTAVTAATATATATTQRRTSLLRRMSRALRAAAPNARRRLSDPDRRPSLRRRQSTIDRSKVNGNVENPVPETISFFQMDIGDSRLVKIAHYVRDNQQVKTINLSFNAFGHDGVFALAMALQEDNNVVERLTLCGNPDMGLSGVVALAQALPRCSQLRALNLSQNHIGNAGCKALAHALAQPTTLLQEVLLHSNRIGSEGAAFLGTALSQNQSIHSLDVSDNVMGDDGVVAIAQGLQSNTTLRTLYVTDNRFSTRAVQALLTLVQESNATLTAINARLRQEPTFEQSRCLDQISYFLQMNLHGRAWMRSYQPNPALLPRVLQPLTTTVKRCGDGGSGSNSNSIGAVGGNGMDSLCDNMPLVYGLLRDVPHVWCFSSPQKQ